MIAPVSDASAFFRAHPVETVAVDALSRTGQLTLYAEKDVALLGVYGNAGHLTLTDGANAAEWRSLIRFLGLSTVTTDAYSASKLRGYKKAERVKLLGMGTPTLSPADEHLVFSPNLRQVHALLSRYLPVSDADTFVSDMQLRINHGVGRSIAYEIDGALVGTASVFFESDTVCFLGGIATDKAYRGRGIASMLVSALCRDALSKQKRPVLTCVNPAAERVYRSLGFVAVGERVTLTY